MSCKRYHKKLSALLDGQLNGLEKDRLEEHLKSCVECAETLRQYAITTERVKQMGLHMLDERALATRIKDRIAARHGASRDERGLSAWRRVPVFALLILIAVGVGNVAGRSIVEAFFPVSEESFGEALLVQNGASLTDAFMDLISMSSDERPNR